LGVCRTVACVCCVLWASGAFAQDAQLQANKQLLLDFFHFQGTREERAAKFLADDYVQHNPRFLAMDKITGAKGRAAWVAAQDEAQRRGIRLVDLAGISLRSDPVVLMAERDLVTAVYKGTMKDPDGSGREWEIFAFETVRIREGKFTEHWDQVTLAPGWNESRPPAAGGRP
jgi:predicted SnoaL-like aldol condensation-catalyzing enzyme